MINIIVGINYLQTESVVVYNFVESRRFMHSKRTTRKQFEILYCNEKTKINSTI